MNENPLNQGITLLDLLQDQIDVFLIIISRPVVLQQLAAFFAVLLIAWILPGVGRWWRRKRRLRLGEDPSTLNKERAFSPWKRVIGHLLTPILSLILLNVMIWIFAQQGHPNSLLENLTNLIWLWLFYRLLVLALELRYGEAVRPYQNRIITPVFLFLELLQFWSTMPGSITFANIFVNLAGNAVTLGNLVLAIIVFYLFVVSTWIIKQLMVHYLPARLNSEVGVIESGATIVNYTLLAVGVIVSLGILGLDFTSLAIVAGGLSVGIGIGLQDIVSNFVSGLVLLFEQSLRPGDVVELDGQISEVEKISLRATLVRTRTNEELIIPNASFTNQQVKNLTRSDRVVRMRIPFGVSYKSDPNQIKQLAIEVGAQHHLVQSSPIPNVLFAGFGESSLDFILLVTINQPELMNAIRSDIYYSLWDMFTEHSIEIPFPQRDLNLRDGWEKLAADLVTT